jgi:hypothetical protein
MSLIGFELLAAFVGQLLGLQGKTREQGILNKIMAGYRAGRNVDAHMREVADTLEAGGKIDWDALEAKLDAETAEFLARGSGGVT